MSAATLYIPDPSWQDDDPAPIHPLLAAWGRAYNAELESEPMPEWTVDELREARR